VLPPPSGRTGIQRVNESAGRGASADRGELHDGVLSRLRPSLSSCLRSRSSFHPIRNQRTAKQLIKLGTEFVTYLMSVILRCCRKRVCRKLCARLAKSSARCVAFPFRVRLMRASRDYTWCCTMPLPHRGLGLINMRESVHRLNGTFEFDSAPARGTTVTATVPFRRAS
jgi:hypothetical protein